MATNPDEMLENLNQLGYEQEWRQYEAEGIWEWTQWKIVRLDGTAPCLWVERAHTDETGMVTISDKHRWRLELID